MKARGNGTWIVLGMTAIIAAVLGTTVLLANDARHLKAALARYELSHWLALPQSSPQQQPDIAMAPQPEPAMQAQTGPAALLFSTTGQTPFARTVRFPPVRICDLLRVHGMEGAQWRPSPAGDGLFECTGERFFTGVTPGEEAQPSLFAIVRGTQDDRLALLRIKLMAPAGTENTEAFGALNAFLEALITDTGWSDLKPLLARIAALENVREEAAGFDLRFSREVTNGSAYNLIVRPSEGKPDIRALEKPQRPTPFSR